MGIMVQCDRNLDSKILAFGLFCDSWDETAFASHADCVLTGCSVTISQHKKKNWKSVESFIYQNSGNTVPPYRKIYVKFV